MTSDRSPRISNRLPKGNLGIRAPRTSRPTRRGRLFFLPVPIRVPAWRTMPDRQRTGRKLRLSVDTRERATRERRGTGEFEGFSHGIPRCRLRIRLSNSGRPKISKRGGRYVRGIPFSFRRTGISNIREFSRLPFPYRASPFRSILKTVLPPSVRLRNRLPRAFSRQEARKRRTLRSKRNCVRVRNPDTRPFSKEGGSLAIPGRSPSIRRAARGLRDGRSDVPESRTPRT